MKKAFKNIWKYFKLFLVIMFIIVEDMTWHKIGEPIYRRVKALQIIVRFKAWVAEIEHRYALLAIFLTVFILMEITSTFGVILMGMGAFYLGLTLYITKIFLTIPAVIIFNTAKKTLLSFWFIRMLFILLLKFKRSKIFRSTKRSIYHLKETFSRFKATYLTREKRNSFYKSLKAFYKRLKE